MNYIVYLNGQSIPILNAGELSEAFFYENESPNATPTLVNSIEVESPDAINIINLHIASEGYMAGIPCTIVDTVTGSTVFDGLANLIHPNNTFNPYRNSRKIVIQEYSQILQKQIESLDLRSFFPQTTYINDGIEITQAEYNTLLSQGVTTLKKVEPNSFAFQKSELQTLFYIINRVPDYEQAALISFSIYILTVQIIDYIKKLSDAANPFTVAEAITNIVYLLALIVALFSLLENLLNTLIQKQKKYYVAYVRDIFTKAFAYLGYSFESSILSGQYSKLFYLESTDDAGVEFSNPTNNPLPAKTLQQFMEEIGSMFNAKFKIYQTEKRVVFERADFFKQNPINFEIPTLQFNSRQTDYTEVPNAADLAQAFELSFVKDSAETNTLTPECPKDVIVTYVPNNITSELNTFTERKTIQIPFAHAIRKNKDNRVDKLINTLYDLVKFFLGAGSIKDLGVRTGCMVLNFDAVPVPKVGILENRKLSKDSTTLLSPLYLYTQFHRASSIMENQYYKVNIDTPFQIIPTEFYRQLKDNNVCKLQGSEADCIITRIERNVETATNIIEYLRKETYTPIDTIAENITLK